LRGEAPDGMEKLKVDFGALQSLALILFEKINLVVSLP